MDFKYSDGGRSNYFKAHSVGDCVVRSISIATEQDYKKIYNDLSKIMGKGNSPRNGVPKQIIKKYMASIGWQWVPTMKVGQGCKVHLNKNELPNGKLVVSVSKHLTAVIDGVIYDTYDCSRGGNRCVYGYFKKD